jgi:8-oxo-dGTP diphosphatase
MNIITEIKEQDINPDAAAVSTSKFEHREAVRAVVVNEQEQVAILNVANRGFHKLPGGGIEANESHIEALNREVMEEIGCQIEIIGELGKVIEYRDEWRQIQTSFCYLAKQIGDQQRNSLTEDEKAWGFEVMWADSIDNAITILEVDKPAGYDGKRMVPRDIAILKAAKTRLL